MKARFPNIKSVIWVVGLCVANPLFALPTVESRTGEPVFRSSTTAQSGGSRTSYPTITEERAAQLTLTQIETLQNEVRELRGTIELQEHELKQLKKSQQDFYIDLDRRLNVLQLSQPRPAHGVSNTPKSQKSNTSTTIIPASTVPIVPSPAKSISMGTENAPSKSGTAVPKPTTVIKNQEATPVVETSLTAVTSASAVKPVTVDTTKAAEITSSKPPIAFAPSTPVDSSSVNSAGPQGEPEAYQAAYGFVRTKRYPEAISAFQNYLNRFPKGDHAVHAHYWLGEVYMVQWQTDKTNVSVLDKASAEFSSITAQFPTHPKAGDATLKLGLIEFDKGNEAAAIQHLTEVKTRYPGTTAARIADTRLQKVSD